ncbi:hypothetical protein HYH02_004909 [Chlamydomonas schloesseri]|uniref:Uncharacterized protein n=1 Tax=Chlamydomonas schloesseri TaxID=2026947 RepID=A0A835WN40_9CHLO|nr:hypothetical protein HYH02_004909 [Chlamydomonas schloesseri]|eukprot:KAG2450407.1 hypothetical protein HYH02_004909 [Chlamydomonas schloesseri]
MTGRGGASPEERDAAAQELFGKRFEECDSMERIKVGGHIGGSRVINHTSGEKHRTLDDGAGGGGDSATSEAGRQMKQQKEQEGQGTGGKEAGREEQAAEEQGAEEGGEEGVEEGVEEEAEDK